MRELSLRETQLVLADMLREFDAFCSLYELEYRLDSGTLLGAIRHKGFIPWDDDIDVSMPRSDYQRLAKFAAGKASVEGLPSNLHFNDCTSGFEKPFMRLHNRDIKVEFTRWYPRKPINELFIDIFPVDGMPADKDEVRARYKHAHTLCRYACERAELLSSVPSIEDRLRRLRRWPKVMLHSAVYYCQKVEEYLAEYPYEKSEYVGVAASYIWSRFPDSVISREAYEEYVLVEFEGMQLKAPAGWDAQLTGCFGDYMTPVQNNRDHYQHVFALQ